MEKTIKSYATSYKTVDILKQTAVDRVSVEKFLSSMKVKKEILDTAKYRIQWRDYRTFTVQETPPPAYQNATPDMDRIIHTIWNGLDISKDIWAITAYLRGYCGQMDSCAITPLKWLAEIFRDERSGVFRKDNDLPGHKHPFLCIKFKDLTDYIDTHWNKTKINKTGCWYWERSTGNQYVMNCTK